MKKAENYPCRFIEINNDELSAINGGSFAYDVGTFLRYFGIYLANGTGISGVAAANADYAVTQFLSGQ